MRLDPNGEKAAQPCYYSYDPELYVNPNHKKLAISVGAVEPAIKPRKVPVIEAVMHGADTGQRTFNVARQIGLYVRKGFSKDLTLTHVLEWNKKNTPPLDEEKVTSTVEDMYKRYDKLPIKYFEKDGSYFKNVKSGFATCMKRKFINYKNLRKIMNNRLAKPLTETGYQTGEVLVKKLPPDKTRELLDPEDAGRDTAV